MVINMSKYARIENGEVMEIITFNPAGKFAPDFVFVECDDTVGERDTYDATTGKFTKFVIPRQRRLLSRPQRKAKISRSGRTDP